MTLTTLLFNFVKFANLAIRSIHAAIQLLQFAVLIAAAIFHAMKHSRRPA